MLPSASKILECERTLTPLPCLGVSWTLAPGMLGIRMLKWSFTSSRTRRSSKMQKQKGWTGHPHAESGNEQERVKEDMLTCPSKSNEDSSGREPDFPERFPCFQRFGLARKENTDGISPGIFPEIWKHYDYLTPASNGHIYDLCCRFSTSISSINFSRKSNFGERAQRADSGILLGHNMAWQKASILH